MDYSNYYRQYIEYVECYRRTVAATVAAEVIKRRRIAAAAFMMHLSKKKKIYEKKKYWVAPIFENRNEHSFFFASVPRLRLEDLRFHNYFRMSATQFEELLGMIGPTIQKQDVVRQCISPSERLALTLRFLASGDSVTSMSYHYLVGVTTASTIIHETCKALWDILCPLVLPGQLHERDWLDIANDYYEKWNFVHCIGAIDGKHVVIQVRKFIVGQIYKTILRADAGNLAEYNLYIYRTLQRFT
ncbi:PREDICTED: uncharacterized protein LOC105568303 isoform X1 [Vollenhovia emeryi]|uniref:uncharacterized protein LOC105568303 isoform X1 n=1 Tax=Vollenhovia emeryi TaxID=411798 RepID=UPI0005F44AB3|nr:PREDICTED: uncharacterized protein LOC105568303 isoform X1 [Vollenhovia emeryi]